MLQSSDMAKLIRVLGLLGSEHDGERAAAAMAAHRLMRRSGQSWQQLLEGGQRRSQAAPQQRQARNDREEVLRATASRLRQAQRENADLHQQITRLRRRLEASFQRHPAPAEPSPGAAQERGG